MSLAAVAARQADRKLRRLYDADLVWMGRVEACAALDAVLARCDGCGLEQVASPGCPPCVLCGGETGVFVAYLPGHPRFPSEAEAMIPS